MAINTGKAATDAGIGATGGAALGSVVPGVGTVAGGVIGGIGGALYGAFSGGSNPTSPSANPANFQFGQGNGSTYANQVAGALSNRGNEADANASLLASQAQGAYGVAANAQGIGAPQIQQDLQDRQRTLAALGGTNQNAGQLNQLGTNGLPMGLAEAQLQQGQNAAMNQSLALAHSGRSLGSGAAALQNAQFQNAQTNQITNQQAATANIQEQQQNAQFKLGALGASGNLYGQAGNQASGINSTDLGVQNTNAGLQQNQAGINNQTSGTFIGAGQGLNAAALGQQTLGQNYQSQGIGVLNSQLNANQNFSSQSLGQGNIQTGQTIASNTANTAALSSGLQSLASGIQTAGQSGSTTPVNPNNPSGSTSPMNNITKASDAAGPATPNFGGGTTTKSLNLPNSSLPVSLGGTGGGLQAAPAQAPASQYGAAIPGQQAPQQQQASPQNVANNSSVASAKAAAAGAQQQAQTWSDKNIKTNIQPLEAKSLQPSLASSRLSLAALSGGSPRAVAAGPLNTGPSAMAALNAPVPTDPASYGGGGMPSGAPTYAPAHGSSAALASALGQFTGAGTTTTMGAAGAPPGLQPGQYDPYLASVAGPQHMYLPSGYIDPVNQAYQASIAAPQMDSRWTSGLHMDNPGVLTNPNPSVPGATWITPTPAGPPPSTAPAPYTGPPKNVSHYDFSKGPAPSATPKPMVHSDVHSKTRIQQLEGQLAALQPSSQPPAVDLRPAQGYRYEYKDPAAHGRGTFFGPLAQDLQRTPAGASTVNQAPDGTLAVDGSRLALVNTSAISELQRKHEAMQAQLAALGAR